MGSRPFMLARVPSWQSYATLLTWLSRRNDVVEAPSPALINKGASRLLHWDLIL